MGGERRIEGVVEDTRGSLENKRVYESGDFLSGEQLIDINSSCAINAGANFSIDTLNQRWKGLRSKLEESGLLNKINYPKL